MAISFDKALGVHEQALMLRAQRQEVLAANLANADTPGYKARDIDFKAALQASRPSAGGELPLATTRSNHLSAGGQVTGAGQAALMFRMPLQPALDGNTVETHVEQGHFADNTLRYQASLQFLGSRFSSLKSILQGGR